MAPNRDPATGRFVSGGSSGGSSSGGGGGSSGGFNLGNAYGAVIIDVSGVGSAMQQAQSMIAGGLSGISSSLQSLGDYISSIGDQFTQLGGALSTFSVPILAAGGAGLKAAADFDTLLKQIEIFGNVAPNQLDTVRQFALKMGADTKFSSADAASALLELLKAGQSLDEAMKSLPEVLNLAATGNLSLAQASGIVSSALAIFKLKADDAGRVSNALAQAANATRADVGDLGQGLANVGPIAAQFGLSIEDTSAILGVFANNGIMGAEAGTQLKSMLLNMARPTDKVTGAFAKLGVSLYDSQGNARNFNTVIKELDAALDKLPVEQQNAIMQDLAGSYGIVGLNALRASNGIDNTLQAMANAPSAGKVAATFMETFKGTIESLTGSLETLMISGLTPLMNDVLTPIVGQITQVVNAITDWVQKNPQLTKQITKVLGVVALLGPGLLIVGKVMSAVGSLVSTVGAILGAVASPIGLIAAALVGLYVAFEENFLGIRDLIEPFVRNFINNLDEIWGSITNFGNNLKNMGLGGAIASVIDSVMEALGLAANSDEMDARAQQIGDGIANAFGTMANFLQTTVLPILQTFGNWFLTDALPAVVTFIQTQAIPGIQTLFTFLGNVWSVVAPALGNLANWFLTDALPKIRDFVVGEALPKLQEFFGWLGRTWDETIKPGLGKLYTWFVEDALPKVRDFVYNTFWPNVQTVFNWLANVWETTIKPGIGKLYDWFVTDALPKIKTFVEVDFKNALDAVFGWLANVWETTIKPGLDGMYQWFVGQGGLQGIIVKVQEFTTEVGKVPGKLQDWTTANQKTLEQLGDLGLSLFLAMGAIKLYSIITAAAAIATGLGTGLAGTIAAATTAAWASITAFLAAAAPVVALMLAIYATIEAYKKFQETINNLKPGYQAAGKAAGVGIQNGLTQKDVNDQWFQNAQGQFGGGLIGDLFARWQWDHGGSLLAQGVYTQGLVANSGVQPLPAVGGGSAAPLRDVGGPGLAGMEYQIGRSQLKNEVYIPGADGQFVPNFVNMMKDIADGLQGGNGQQYGDIIVQMPASAVANPAEAYAAGQDFGRGIQDEMRARGIKSVKT